MRKLLVPTLCASIAAFAASAQSLPPLAIPHYLAPRANEDSEINAMTPPAASATAAPDAGSNAPAAAAETSLSTYTYSQSHRPMRTRSRIGKPQYHKSSDASDDPYRTDIWDTDRLYTDPRSVDPLNTR
jgi:hypothetical protein